MGPGSVYAEHSSVHGDVVSYAQVLSEGEASLGMAARVERIVKSLAWVGSVKHFSRLVMPDARDVALAYVMGRGEPSIAFVCSVSGDDEVPWSESVWLSIMDRLEESQASSPLIGTVYMFLVDEAAIGAVAPNPEFTLGQERLLPVALADMGVEAIVLLDFNHPPTQLSMAAASLRHMSPRKVLVRAREASEISGVDIHESPVSDFYAAAGLASGSFSLAPWLDAGLPAIAIGSLATPIGDDPAAEAGIAIQSDDVNAFFEAFARQGAQKLSLEASAGKTSGDDFNYLRYPLPRGSIIIADHIITGLTLAVLAIVALGFALGFLKGRERSAQLVAVAREVLSAIVLSLLALFGSNMLASMALRMAGYSQGRGAYVSESLSRWNSALALLLRFFCALAIYYVASGTASRLKLMGRHRRIDAARAALALLCVNLLITVALRPAAAPFFILAVVVCALFSEKVVTTGVGLFLVTIVFLPFLDPRVISDMGYYTAGSGSVAAALLGVGTKGTIAMGAFVAPFSLWLAAASSPDASLNRGKKTVLLWALAALALATAEGILSKALTGL